MHKREYPKARAEARKADWERFTEEIERLDARIEVQNKRIKTLEDEVETCHAIKTQQSIEIARLTAIVEGSNHGSENIS